MNTTSHFHTTVETTGLRQCTDPRCGAWTNNGVNWALRPETLMFVQDAYPTGELDDYRRMIQAAARLAPTLTVQAADLQPA